MAGQPLKGALISFTPAFAIPVPNVIVFQYNPETITHAWTAAAAGAAPAPAAGSSAPATDPLAVSGVPGEQFTFTLSVDSNDSIADNNLISGALAKVSGVYTRLAALEMLQFPASAFTGGLVGAVSSAISSAASGLTGSAPSQPIPQSDVPVAIFVWGPLRIVPVRLTALSITEKLYDSLLNPTHADVQITLRVLTPQELVAVQGIMGTLANAAYQYSQGLRVVGALANLGDAAESIIGMLPSPF